MWHVCKCETWRCHIVCFALVSQLYSVITCWQICGCRNTIPVEFQRLREIYRLQQFSNVKTLTVSSFCRVLTLFPPQAHLLCTKLSWDTLRVYYPFGNKVLRRQTAAAFGDRKTADLRGNSQHLFLNEAQWLKLASLITWESDTSTLLEILLRAVADESGPGITQLPHSHLQIWGWQSSSASFNYEWQPFISCLLIRWVDAAALATFSLLFWYLRHIGVEHISWGEKKVRKNILRIWNMWF